MKRLLAIAVLFLAVAARADCPFSVKCNLDGEMMLQEECYYNGLHKTCRFAHDHWGPNGKEHHVVNVPCD